MKKTFIAIVLLTSLILGQDSEDYIIQGKQKIEAAYFAWDKAAMLEARAHFERPEESWLTNYYIAYCDYRLISYEFGQDDKNAAKQYINDAILQLDKCLDAKPDCADAYALLSSLYGDKIALNPWSGIWYGPKVGKMMEQAFATDPNNPRVYLINGVSAFYTPDRWGGGREKAEQSLKKAAELFKTEKIGKALPDWGHSETYAWLGMVALARQDTIQARQYYNEALVIDPDFGWVKYQLLPQIEK
jgi:tetratricopeptide (TPR) repeat protein